MQRTPPPPGARPCPLCTYPQRCGAKTPQFSHAVALHNLRRLPCASFLPGGHQGCRRVTGHGRRQARVGGAAGGGRRRPRGVAHDGGPSASFRHIARRSRRFRPAPGLVDEIGAQGQDVALLPRPLMCLQSCDFIVRYKNRENLSQSCKGVGSSVVQGARRPRRRLAGHSRSDQTRVEQSKHPSTAGEAN